MHYECYCPLEYDLLLSGILRNLLQSLPYLWRIQVNLVCVLCTRPLALPGYIDDAWNIILIWSLCWMVKWVWNTPSKVVRFQRFVTSINKYFSLLSGLHSKLFAWKVRNFLRIWSNFIFILYIIYLTTPSIAQTIQGVPGGMCQTSGVCSLC